MSNSMQNLSVADQNNQLSVPSVPVNANPPAAPVAPDIQNAAFSGGLAGLAGGPGLPLLPAAPAPRQIRNIPPPTPLTFGEKVKAAATKLGTIPGKGTLAPIALAAIDALGSGGGLGDAAAVGKVEPGGGWLEGVSRTLAARGQRQAQQRKDLSEEQKNAAMTAHENLQMHYTQKLLHNLDEQDINTAVTNGQNVVKNVTTGEAAAPIISDDATSDQLETLIAQNHLNPSEQHAQPTGRKVVGENEDGTPIYRTTYTVYGNQKDVTPDDDFVKRYNTAFPDKQPMTAGKAPVLPGKLYNYLEQQMSNIEAATAARNKTLLDNKIQADKNSRGDEVVNIGPEWNNALAMSKNNPDVALATLQANPDIAKKYPHLRDDVIQAYGGQKAWDDYEKNQETERHNKAMEGIKATPKTGKDLLADIQTKNPVEAAMAGPAPDVSKYPGGEFDPAYQTAVQAYAGKVNSLNQENKPPSYAGVVTALHGTDRVDDASNHYSNFANQTNVLSDAIQAGQDGNQVANSIATLGGALMITTAAGVHRINTTEVAQFGGQNGISAANEINQYLDKKAQGKVPANIVNDWKQLVKSYQDNTYSTYVNQASVIAANNKLNRNEVMVLSKDGKDTIPLSDALKQANAAPKDVKKVQPPTVNTSAVPGIVIH